MRNDQKRMLEQLLAAGFTPDSVIEFVNSHDFSELNHTGKLSVQLHPADDVKIPMKDGIVDLRDAGHALLHVIGEHGEARRDDPEVAAFRAALNQDRDRRTADDLWNWLLACLECGEVHPLRVVAGGPTFVHPDDGHPPVLRADGGMWWLRDKWDREAR
jgi:hypothetical protein